MFSARPHGQKTPKFPGLYLSYTLKYDLNLPRFERAGLALTTHIIHLYFLADVLSCISFLPRYVESGHFLHSSISKGPVKNEMVATIQTKWKHNPRYVDTMAQKHLDRRDRYEPSYEHFSELMSRVSDGARRP